MNFNILPYMEIDGIRTLSDSQLRQLYIQLVQENVIHLAFPDGSVTNSAAFIAMMKDPNQQAYILLDKDNVPLVLTRIYNKFHRTAFMHTVSFRAGYGKIGIDIGNSFLDDLLSRTIGETKRPIFTSLYGIIDKENKLIQRFITKLGAKPLHIIPKAYFNIYENEDRDGILYLIRENK